VPGRNESLKFEIESGMKVKRLKEFIYEKIGGDIKPERFKLQIEGGDVLEKSQK
jgi:hypothetical protein